MSEELHEQQAKLEAHGGHDPLVNKLVGDHSLYTRRRVLAFLKTCTLDEMRGAFDTIGCILDDPRVTNKGQIADLNEAVVASDDPAIVMARIPTHGGN